MLTDFKFSIYFFNFTFTPDEGDEANAPLERLDPATAAEGDEVGPGRALRTWATGSSLAGSIVMAMAPKKNSILLIPGIVTR